MRKDINKLVRDRIPEKIVRVGKNAHIRILDDIEMEKCLERKLVEEVNEYLSDKTVEELADIIEVVYAICKMRGVSKEELEGQRVTKAIANGAFDEQIFLEYTETIGHVSEKGEIIYHSK